MNILKKLWNIIWTYRNRLVSLMVLSASATQEVLGSIPRSSKVLLGFFYVIVSSSSELGFVPG